MQKDPETPPVLSFLMKSLFLFSNNGLQYYNPFTKIKTFRIFDPSIFCCGGDYLIVGTGRGLALFGMNKNKFMRDDSSDEAEKITVKNIASTRSNDLFLHHLEILEDNFSVQTVHRFYEFLGGLDFNKLKEYLYAMASESIGIILNMILKILN